MWIGWKMPCCMPSGVTCSDGMMGFSGVFDGGVHGSSMPAAFALATAFWASPPVITATTLLPLMMRSAASWILVVGVSPPTTA